MSTTTKPNEYSKLRLEAEARLAQGTAPPTNGWSSDGGALFLLYKLASLPESASDALKLLHELQVHQVELDLQHEQMDIALHEFTEELVRYKGLYEFAPAAYFCVDNQGNIIEGNRAAAALLGVSQNELPGRHIDSFLAAESRPLLLELLERLRHNDASEGCEVLSGGEATATRRIQIAASVTSGGSFLMIFSECGKSQVA